jgi:ligand-binding SRPBCC domain-containing protein
MRYVKESFIAASPELVFEFHTKPGVLEMLTPPWEKVRVIEAADISRVGTRAIVEARLLGPIKKRWISEHVAYDPPRMFEDVQVEGPWSSWRHRHVIKPEEEGAILKDEIDYEPPFGFLGRLLAPFLFQSRLERLFNYRHEVTRAWCEQREKAKG